jgi:hypothetical protein
MCSGFRFICCAISFLLLFCSTADWALSLFYKFNCWANRYFEEGKKMHRPINLINIEQSLKKSAKKMQQTCSRILAEHMIGDYKNYKALGT